MGVVGEKPKRRIVHGTTFGSGKGEGGRVVRCGERNDGDWSKIPGCQLSGVMKEISKKRILRLRAKFGFG